jgi:hypothetical protein
MWDPAESIGPNSLLVRSGGSGNTCLDSFMEYNNKELVAGCLNHLHNNQTINNHPPLIPKRGGGFSNLNMLGFGVCCPLYAVQLCSACI